jgi:DNA polymerase-4
MAIFEELTPRVEKLGIDEAFLDVAGARRIFGSPMQVAQLLRTRVRAETGLVVSVGAAATKFVAKVASGLSKPDGLLVVPLEGTVAFLHPLPIAKLWVGGKTEEVLLARGYRTIGDIAAASVPALQAIVGESAAQRLHELSWGRDPRHVHARPDEKSIGHEMTFETDVIDPEIVRRELLRMSNMVAVRLRRAGMRGRTVVLKLRFGDFTTITRSRTIREPTDLGRTIYDEVRAIYDGLGRHDARIRLVGVRAEQLQDADAAQLGLWDDSEGWRDAEEAMDAATARFGRGAIRPARLLGPEASERPRMGQRD